MGIKRIVFNNFKCFKNLDVTLDDFNVLVGPNASGKSNFISIFKFLRDLDRFGLENAISLQGGVEYFRNLNIGAKENFNLKVELEDDIKISRKLGNELIGFNVYRILYEIELKFYKTNLNYKIVKERLEKNFKIHKLEKDVEGIREVEFIDEGSITLSRNKSKTKIDLSIPKEYILENDILLPVFMKDMDLKEKDLILETPYISYPYPPFQNIRAYDFDPRISKKATLFAGKTRLEEDGSNLPVVLLEVLKNKDDYRAFTNTAKDLLPFISDADIERLTDKSFLLKIKEKYFESNYLPSSFLSDGTINVVALIIALFYQKADMFSIFEEPERNLHPSLISKLISLMKEVSNNKQVLITTHNSEILRHSTLEDILFISRNEDGSSNINKPSQMESVQTFLKNEIGLEELFIQNLIS